MTHKNNHLSPELERYLAHCNRVRRYMEQNGSWPWKQDQLQTPNRRLSASNRMVK